MIFRKCGMPWILSLTIISLTEGLSYGHDQCPEENSSRWRQNLDTYIKEMEELTKRKPGYKATMNTYAPCRPIMENLQCVRSSRGGKTCEVTLYDHAYYRGNFQAKSVKPSQWNPIGTRCYIKFSSQPELYNIRIVWGSIINECIDWKSSYSNSPVLRFDYDFPDEAPESPTSMQDCYDFYFYHEDEEKMTEEECTRIVHENLFPTQPPTIYPTTKQTTRRPTTRSTTTKRTITTRRTAYTRTTTTLKPTTRTQPIRYVTSTLKKTTSTVPTSSPKTSPHVFSPEVILNFNKKTTETPEIVTASLLLTVNTELPDEIDDLFMGFTAEELKSTIASTKKPSTVSTTTKKITTTTKSTTQTTTTTATTASSKKTKFIEKPEAKPVQVQPIQTIVIPLNPSRTPIRSPVARSPSDEQSINQPASDSAFNSISSPMINTMKTRSKCKNGKSCGSHGKCKFVDDEYLCVCQEKYLYSTAKNRCVKSRRKEKTPKWSRWSKWGQCSTTCDEGVQSRYRKCHLPRNSRSTCPGTNEETRTCMNMKCSEHDRRVRKYKKTGKWKGRKWSKWSKYTPCSKTCGGGRKSRSRTCLIPDDKCPSLGQTIQWTTCREERCRIDQIDDS